MENTSQFIERATEVASAKELNKATFEEAVKRAVEAKNRAASFLKRSKELGLLAKQLSAMAYTYASEHRTALTEPLRDLREHTKVGKVEFEDSAYSLTVGIGDPKRIDGSNITEAFKADLPAEWIKMKRELHVDAIKRASDEEREAHGLVCQPSAEWKMVND